MLLVALILVTVTSLLMARAFQPLASSEQRIKEAELMYRGQHIAYGIRNFYSQKGRFPFSLNELIDIEPHFIRQIYKDPMTEDGQWELVFLEASQQEQILDLNSLIKNLRISGESSDVTQTRSEERAGLSQDRTSVFQIRDQQIVGIHSKSDREGFRAFNDSRIYRDWIYTALPKKKALSINNLPSLITTPKD